MQEQHPDLVSLGHALNLDAVGRMRCREESADRSGMGTKLRPSLPESIAVLVWTVALVPLGFVSLGAVAALGLGDGGVPVAARVAWVSGVLAVLLSVFLPTRRLLLSVATAAFAGLVLYVVAVLLALLASSGPLD
jgi:hypothetical protein